MKEPSELHNKIWLKLPDDLPEMSDEQISQVAHSLWLQFIYRKGDEYEPR